MSAEILTGIWESLKTSLYNMIAGFFVTLFSGFLWDLITGKDTGQERLTTAIADVTTNLTNLANSLKLNLGEITATTINAAAQQVAYALDIDIKQTDLVKTLKEDIIGYFDAARKEEEKQAVESHKTGAALTAFWLALLGEDTDTLTGAVDAYFDEIEGTSDIEKFQVRNSAELAMGLVEKFLIADIQSVENISELEASAAAEAVMTVAVQNNELVREWFLNAVVVPVSMGENIKWAVSTAMTIGSDQLKEQIKATITANLEAIDEMMKGGGYVPTP